MTGAFQSSLLDCSDEVVPGPLGSSVRRTVLGGGAWIDVRPGWIAGADTLFERLAETVPWRAEQRQMYDRVVDVPRLQSFYGEGRALPGPALDEARRGLGAPSARERREPLPPARPCPLPAR